MGSHVKANIERAVDVILEHPNIPTDEGNECPQPECKSTKIYGPNSPTHARHLATALAGAGLIPGDLPQLDRPEPVDPSEVRVGDVVEIEGDDWMVRGRVTTTSGSDRQKPISIGVPFNFGSLWPNLTDATVRVLHHAHPEPDREQIRELTRAFNQALEDAPQSQPVIAAPRALIVALAKRGVQVVSRDA